LLPFDFPKTLISVVYRQIPAMANFFCRALAPGAGDGNFPPVPDAAGRWCLQGRREVKIENSKFKASDEIRLRTGDGTAE
jgi:hypothetical protein